ncbi:unnamed protein product [Rotaria sordida]|uniref:Uncharacterized protein n=1 Tax=Rotaria sordida TaxID=392033 RepID=A0A814C9B7_9BILA|nr:unnamed protein product [Rotaria sordida]
MDKIDNPYLIMLERLHVLDQSIYILNLVNNDLRQILQKQKRLPQFIYDSFKRSTINKSKTSPSLPPPPQPSIESEEISLAASIIDKAKRTIENIDEKKPKQLSHRIATAPTSTQSSTVQNNRSKTSSSVRPSSASSTIAPSSDSSLSQQQQPIRRYVPAHMKAPFLTQPEKKRRPTSSIRTSAQTNSSKKPSATPRSISQQRRQSSSSIAHSIVELPQQITPIPAILPVENEKNSIINGQSNNDMNDETIIPEQTSVMITTDKSKKVSNETSEIDVSSVPQPIILNQALIKPLRRLWKQNQNLRLRLEIELKKRSTTSSSSPVFIDRLNEKIHSPTITDEIHIPNIEVLLQLAVKLRTIVLYLLENSTFDNPEGTVKRLNTLKYLVNQYHRFFTSNINILVAKHDYCPSNINTNIEEWLNKSKISPLNRNIVRYTDDSQLIAFTEVRFKQFENECRWIELNCHEQMIMQFKQSLLKQNQNQNQNTLQIYRELMCLVTGLQTSTPIVVENKFE